MRMEQRSDVRHRATTKGGKSAGAGAGVSDMALQCCPLPAQRSSLASTSTVALAVALTPSSSVPLRSLVMVPSCHVACHHSPLGRRGYHRLRMCTAPACFLREWMFDHQHRMLRFVWIFYHQLHRVFGHILRFCLVEEKLFFECYIKYFVGYRKRCSDTNKKN